MGKMTSAMAIAMGDRTMFATGRSKPQAKPLCNYLLHALPVGRAAAKRPTATATPRHRMRAAAQESES